jgi:hypothetical protein
VERQRNAKGTTPEDRQVIARTLLDRIIVTVEDASEKVDIEIRFAGGFVSRIIHRRPVQTYDQLSNYRELIERIKQLKDANETLANMAITLNEEGFRPPKRAQKFNRGMVCRLLRRERERLGVQGQCTRDRSELKKDEWWLSDLALHLKMPLATLHRWLRVGWVSARKVDETGGHWAVYASADELERLKKLRGYRRGWGEQKTPAELTMPIIK